MYNEADNCVPAPPMPSASDRTKQTQRRLKMYTDKAKRDSKGNVIKETFQSDKPQEDGRIIANRKYFANTRISSQNELETMREAITQKNNPNVFLLKDAKLPDTLLRPPKEEQPRLETVEPFHETFGPKAVRRTAKICAKLDELIQEAAEETNAYKESKDTNIMVDDEPKIAFDPHMIRGETQRVFSEIYKVIDSSDVLVYVLDARDPEGTMNKQVLKHLSLPENRHRHLIYLLNKIDLVPIWSTKSWILKLQQERPTVAFCASSKRKFGKAELISVFREFSQFHRDKPNISVGFLGYPNVGKSSVINALVGKDSCNVAPIPGETKVWEYVNLTKKIFLIDAPGVVFPTGDGDQSEEDILLRGVIRCEHIDQPELLIPTILQRVKPEYINKVYEIKSSWSDAEDLLEVIGRQQGRLLKGGDVDKRTVARKVLEDYVRGRLPHFVAAFTAGEVLTYNEKMQEKKIHIEEESDSALIQFVNRQKLNAVQPDFQFDESDNEFVPDEEVEEKNEQEPPENPDESHSFSSDDLDGAFDEEMFEAIPRRIRANELDVKADVKHTQKKQIHQKGVQRATKLIKTRDRELVRAANSGVVNEQDLELVIKHKKLRSKRETTGGFKGTKTGSTFYADAKAKRVLLSKLIGKRM